MQCICLFVTRSWEELWFNRNEKIQNKQLDLPLKSLKIVNQKKYNCWWRLLFISIEKYAKVYYWTILAPPKRSATVIHHPSTKKYGKRHDWLHNDKEHRIVFVVPYCEWRETKQGKSRRINEWILNWFAMLCSPFFRRRSTHPSHRCVYHCFYRRFIHNAVNTINIERIETINPAVS